MTVKLVATALSASENETVTVTDALPRYGETCRVDGDGYTYTAFFSQRNARIRVVDYQASNHAAMIHSLKAHALHQQAGKFFFKCRTEDAASLKSLGLREEARIHSYFNGSDAVVMSFFTDEQRMMPAPDKNTRDEIIENAQRAASGALKLRALPDGFTARIAEPADAGQLSTVFAANFASYPFPVFDADYVSDSMRNGVVYMMICQGANIAAVASAETVPSLRNAEMTDFATMPKYRGNGFGAILLHELEKEMPSRGIEHLYTLSRASAISINRIFGKAGYKYTGTLVRNCHISGDFEDMNCWCKSLRL